MSEWRTGKKVGRTIYDGDKLIGVMDTPELAKRVVDAAQRWEECHQSDESWPPSLDLLRAINELNALQAMAKGSGE